MDRNRNEPKISVLIELATDRHNKPETYPLGVLLTHLLSTVQQLSTKVEQLSRDLDAQRSIRERAAQTDAMLRQMERLIAAVQEKAEDVDSRLNEVMASVDTLIVGRRQEERDIDHHSFQREFTALVNQDIGALVELIARHRNLADRDRALLTARICWLLFGEERPLREPLFQEINDQPSEMRDRCGLVLAAAEDLRSRVAQYKNQHWDFSFQPGMRVDPSFQELWPSYPGGDLVEFVVVPSYVIEGYSILSKQRVYGIGPGAEADARPGSVGWPD